MEPHYPPNSTCKHCGRKAKDHRLANYADGPLIGLGFIVCPTSVFEQQQPREADALATQERT